MSLFPNTVSKDDISVCISYFFPLLFDILSGFLVLFFSI